MYYSSYGKILRLETIAPLARDLSGWYRGALKGGEKSCVTARDFRYPSGRLDRAGTEFFGGSAAGVRKPVSSVGQSR